MPRYYKPKINKFVTLTVSMPVLFSAGLGYSFGIWAPSLKHAYDLNEREMSIIGASCNVGGYLSIFSGLIYDALEHRHHVGPRLTLILGCFVNLVGFGLLWGAATLKFHASVWQLAFVAGLACLGGTFFDTSAVSTSLRNFPAHRGTVLGIMKSGVGLSSAVYAAAYTGIFTPRADRFLLFLAIVPTVVGVFCTIFINFVPFVQRSEIDMEQTFFTTEGRFWYLLNTTAGLALYLMASALIQGLSEVSTVTRAVLAAGTVILLVPLFFMPIGSGGIFARKAPLELQEAAWSLEPVSDYEDEDDDEDEEEDGEQPLLLESQAGESATHAAPRRSRMSHQHPRPIVESVGPVTALRRLDFWLLALVCGIGIGCGLAFLNNISQLVEAQRGPDEARGVLVSLFGVANCGGRLSFGAIPEHFLHSYGTPRPIFLVVSSVLTAGAFAGLAYASFPVVYILALAAGIAFGAHWTLMPALASEIFGLDSFASIYTMLQLSPAVGGYALGAGLVWSLYRAALHRHGQPDTGTCVGADCFKASFLTMSGLAIFSTFLSLWLMIRTRQIYRDEVAALKHLERGLARRVGARE